MTTLSDPRPLYYRHSGRFNTARLPVAILTSAAAALVLASAYSYIVLYLPIIGYITFLITAGFGLGVGYAITYLFRWAKVRNIPLTYVTAAGLALFALYWAWMIYIYALSHSIGDDVELWTILTNPAADWEFIQELNAKGAWSMNSTTPTGIALALIWLVEAAAIVGLATWLPAKLLAEHPFCETCNTWGASRPLATLAPATNIPTLKTALEAKDFSALERLGPLPNESRIWTVVTLQGCSACDTTQTLSVDSVTRTYDNKGKAKDKRTPIVHQLRLNSEETIALAQAVATAMTPPAPPPGLNSQETIALTQAVTGTTTPPAPPPPTDNPTPTT